MKKLLLLLTVLISGCSTVQECPAPPTVPLPTGNSQQVLIDERLLQACSTNFPTLASGNEIDVVKNYRAIVPEYRAICENHNQLIEVIRKNLVNPKTTEEKK